MLITRILILAVFAQVPLVFPMVGECASLGSRDRPGQYQHERWASSKNGGAGSISELEMTALTRRSERRKSHRQHNPHARPSGARKSELQNPDGPFAIPVQPPPVPPALLESLGTTSGPSVQRQAIYVNHCTSGVKGGVLRLHRNRVDAKGFMNDPLANLTVESAGRARVRIHSASSNRSLCFNKEGKLVVKKNGKGPLCEFYQTLSKTGHFQFYSAYKTQHAERAQLRHNPSQPHSKVLDQLRPPEDAWFVGFDERGNPLSGISRYDNPRCYELMNLAPPVRETQPIDVPPGVNKNWLGEALKNRTASAGNAPVADLSGSGGVSVSLVSRTEPVSVTEKAKKAKKNIPNAKRTPKNQVQEGRTRGLKTKLDSASIPVLSEDNVENVNPAAPVKAVKTHEAHHAVASGASPASQQATDKRRKKKPSRRKAEPHAAREAPATAAQFAQVPEPLTVSFPFELPESAALSARLAARSEPHSSAESTGAGDDSSISQAARSAFILLDEGGWREVTVAPAPAPPFTAESEEN